MEHTFKTNNFDLLRIVAASQVVLTHAVAHLQLDDNLFVHISSFFQGVPMFFVISGFLISASLERSRDLKSYFTKRVLRIYPALWVCMVLTLPVIYLVGHIDFYNSATLPWFISQCVGIIYTPHFLDGYGFGSYNGSLWTIPIELQFYIALPILYAIAAWFASKRWSLNAIIIAAFIASIVFAYFFYSNYPTSNPSSETKIQKLIRYSFVPHFFMFLLGAIFQRLKIFESKVVNGKGVWLAIAYVIFSLVMPNNTMFSLLSKLFLGLTTISLAYTIPTIGARLLKGNDISYGVYIYHGIIIGVLVELGWTGSYYYALLAFVCSCICGLLSWNYVERPILRRKEARQYIQLSSKAD